MNAITIGGFKRISKRAAEKLYNAGEVVRMCPINISPVNIWGFFVDCHKDVSIHPRSNTAWSVPSNEFTYVVNVITQYNCNVETGRYLAFYVKDAA